MNDPEKISEVAVFSWYDYLNKEYSVLFFTAAIASHQCGNYSAEVATISVLFLTFHGWMLGNKKEISRHTDRIHRYKGRVSLAINYWLKTPLFQFGVLTLTAVANGLNIKLLAGISVQSLLHIHL